MNVIIKIAATAAAVWVAVWLVPGLEFDGSVWALAGVSVLVVVANATVKPVLNLFSLPLILITLGLFLLVTNALAFQVVVWISHPDRLDLGLTSTGFFWATFFGALVVSVVRMILDRVLD